MSAENDVALVLLHTILEMSDHAEKMGGAGSISGVAALHRMQSSIQKNKSRILQAIKKRQAEIGEVEP